MKTKRCKPSVLRRIVTIKKSAFISLIVGLIFAPGASAAVLIDFESIASGTVVRDEFLSSGLQVTGVGAFSARVQSTGDFAVGNFGNSQTQWAHMGLREEATTLTFVDPTDSNVVLGASSFQIRVGDGNADAETFSFTYFDVAGTQIGAPLTFTTFAAGLTVSATSLDLGALIGSVEMKLLAASESGAAFDDVRFTLASVSNPVPEPGTLGLLGLGLLGLGLRAVRRKRGGVA